MILNKRLNNIAFIIFMSLFSFACEELNDPIEKEIQTVDLSDFPEFITPNSEYFTTRIAGIPNIPQETYTLMISGAVDHPDTLTLDELYELDQEQILLTVECIGNLSNGQLVSTAQWEGFNLYNLLLSKGLLPSAEAVQFHCADGYFASYSLDQIRNGSVLGALFMNGDTLPSLHGFPLRILIPGYYGVKQPAWVTRIEVLDVAGDDFWNQYGWDTSPPMPTDSKILFPAYSSEFLVGDTVRIGGTAFGGTLISAVEISIDEGNSWISADIVKQVDTQNVWVFWMTEIVFKAPGEYSIQSRSTDIFGNIQSDLDNMRLDGTDSWPSVRVNITQI